jgi:two-component sensor histidine kinase
MLSPLHYGFVRPDANRAGSIGPMANPVSENETRTGPPRRPWPIAVYLAILVLVMLVPAFIFSAVLLARNNAAQEETVETLIVGTARAMVQAVEGQIEAKIATLKILAGTPSLRTGDFAGFHASVKAALADTGTSIYLLDSHFDTILSTRQAYPSTPVRSADLDSAQKAIEGGDLVISNVIFGAVSKTWVFNLLYPVIAVDRAPMVLGLSQSAEALSGALLDNKLPDGWNVAIVDRGGTVVAASSGEMVSGDAFTLMQADMMIARNGWSSLTRDGQQMRAVIAHSPLTGWTVVGWAPALVVEQPLTTSLLALILGGLIFLLGASVLTFYLAREIQKSVGGLARDARRLGAGDAVPATNYPIAEIAEVSQAIGTASRQRVAAETEVRFLMREVAHRSKNQMTVISAMAKQTAKGERTIASFLASFEKRIMGLARSTDLLLAHGAAGIDLRDIITHQLEPFAPVEGEHRVSIEGPAMRLNTQAAQIIGMAAHELATNAVKYGAFAGDSGTLSVTWSAGTERVHLVWREKVPALRRRAPRAGFGTVVLQSMVGRALGAKVIRTLNRDGIEWVFDIPLAAFNPQLPPDARETNAGGETSATETANAAE